MGTSGGDEPGVPASLPPCQATADPRSASVGAEVASGSAEPRAAFCAGGDASTPAVAAVAHDEDMEEEGVEGAAAANTKAPEKPVDATSTPSPPATRTLRPQTLQVWGMFVEGFGPPFSVNRFNCNMRLRGLAGRYLHAQGVGLPPAKDFYPAVCVVYQLLANAVLGAKADPQLRAFVGLSNEVLVLRVYGDRVGFLFTGLRTARRSCSIIAEGAASCSTAAPAAAASTSPAAAGAAATATATATASSIPPLISEAAGRAWAAAKQGGQQALSSFFGVDIGPDALALWLVCSVGGELRSQLVCLMDMGEGLRALPGQ